VNVQQINDYFLSYLNGVYLIHKQKVQWKKKIGLRDESIYRNGAAGDGANQKHKRQG